VAGRRKQRRTRRPTDDPAAGSEGAHLQRIAKLLALLAVKGEQQRDQILTLDALGYSPAEIAELLRTTANTVSVTLSKHKSREAIGRKVRPPR